MIEPTYACGCPLVCSELCPTHALPIALPRCHATDCRCQECQDHRGSRAFWRAVREATTAAMNNARGM